MEPISDSAWARLVWHSLRLELAPRHDIGFDSRHPSYPKLHALLKNVPAVNADGQTAKRAFHVPEQLAHCFKCRSGQGFMLDILFFGGDGDAPARWLEAFKAYLERDSRRANFTLLAAHAAVRHDGLECCARDALIPPHAELDFLSPLPFARSPGSVRTGLKLDIFVAQLRRRAANLFGVELPAPLAGHFFLEDDRGLRYAELNKAEGYPVRLRLVPRGRYQLVRAGGGEIASIEAGSGLVRLAFPVEEKPIAHRARGDEEPSGAFAEAFGLR
jgi:hypothetical protein